MELKTGETRPFRIGHGLIQAIRKKISCDSNQDTDTPLFFYMPLFFALALPIFYG